MVNSILHVHFLWPFWWECISAGGGCFRLSCLDLKISLEGSELHGFCFVIMTESELEFNPRMNELQIFI